MLQRIRNYSACLLFYVGTILLSLPENLGIEREWINKYSPQNKYLKLLYKIFILAPLLGLFTVISIINIPFSMICLYISLAISPLKVDMLDITEGLLLDEVVKQQMEVEVNVTN